MSTKELNSEFRAYWSELNDEEKYSLLITARELVEAKQEDAFVTDLREAVLLEERNSYLRSEGLSYSWEKIKKMAQGKPRRAVF